MRLFEKEAHFIREQAYQNFLVYCKLWYEVAHHYTNFDEEMDCPEAQRAYNRAMNQRALANFLDPHSSYNFYFRYANDNERTR